MDCQVFGCKLDSFTFCQSQFLVGLRYIHIFNSSCRIQGLEIFFFFLLCICETYPFALFYLVTGPRNFAVLLTEVGVKGGASVFMRV